MRIMTKAIAYVFASGAIGHALATALSAPLTALILTRYGHAGAVAGDPGALGWLGAVILASAAAAAIAVPFASSRARPGDRAIAFFGSFAVSVALAAMSVTCATSPSGPVLAPDAALAHAGHWLFVGWFFAQVTIAGALLVIRTHDDSHESKSSFSTEGYAALDA
jgi:hypothetical protein